MRFLSKAVWVGFLAGLALEVLVSQIRKIMNVSIDAEGWFREVWALIKAVPDASLASVAVGVGTIVMLRLLPRISPRLPAALIALVVVTVVVAIVDPGGVKRLGEVPSGLPHLTFPRFGFGVWVDLMPMALAIAALTVAEGLLIAKNSARANRESFAPTPELFAMGAANVAAAFTGAMPLGASSSRTAALNAAGSRSQVKMLVAAGVVVLIVLFFTKAVSELPSAALAGGGLTALAGWDLWCAVPPMHRGPRSAPARTHRSTVSVRRRRRNGPPRGCEWSGRVRRCSSPTPNCSGRCWPVRPWSPVCAGWCSVSNAWPMWTPLPPRHCSRGRTKFAPPAECWPLRVRVHRWCGCSIGTACSR